MTRPYRKDDKQAFNYGQRPILFKPAEKSSAVYLLPGLLGAGVICAYLNYRTHQEILLLKVETALATGRQL